MSCTLVCLTLKALPSLTPAVVQKPRGRTGTIVSTALYHLPKIDYVVDKRQGQQARKRRVFIHILLIIW